MHGFMKKKKFRSWPSIFTLCNMQSQKEVIYLQKTAKKIGPRKKNYEIKGYSQESRLMVY